MSLKVPPKSQSGSVVRLRGKGVARRGREAGDLYVHFLVAIPDVDGSTDTTAPDGTPEVAAPDALDDMAFSNDGRFLFFSNGQYISAYDLMLGTVSASYRVRIFPTFYVLDPRGRIAWRSDGEQPDALLRRELLEAAAA